MNAIWERLRVLVGAGGAPDRVVPPTGATARLTVLSAACMAFLAVFALALALAAGRQAASWSAASEGVTLRLAEPGQVAPVLALLATTPGVREAHAIGAEETAALLEPWLGPDLPMESLPMPALVAVTQDGGLDLEALRIRLSTEAPGAVVDDHDRWREPMVAAASRLRWLAVLSALLTAGAMAAIITLAAHAALAAHAQPIRVLRMVGARDDYIGQAFMRRFTRRAAIGAAAGTAAGVGALALLPQGAAGAVLPQISLSGAGWAVAALVPLVAVAIALAAARVATRRILRATQ